jgi:hypothetical protein
MLDTPLQSAAFVDRRARKLADAMFNIAVDGDITKAALELEGFSAAEVDQLGAVAYRMMEKRRVRQDAIDEDLPDDRVLDMVGDRCGLIDEGHVISTLREGHVPLRQIERLWPQIQVKLADVARHLPLPPTSELRRAFA